MALLILLAAVVLRVGFRWPVTELLASLLCAEVFTLCKVMRDESSDELYGWGSPNHKPHVLATHKRATTPKPRPRRNQASKLTALPPL